MKNKKLWIIGSVILLGLIGYLGYSFWFASPKDEYTSQVLQVLELKNLGVNPGFKNVMVELLDSLRCQGVNPQTGKDTCKLPFRFQHLKNLSQQDYVLVAEYRGQICNMTAPSAYQDAQQELCNSLKKIYLELNSVFVSTDQVGKLLTNNTAEVLDPLLGELSNRLETTRNNLIKTVKALQKYAWLEPALPPLPAE
jgi:hypothetical protein